MTDDASGCRPARTACGLHLVNARRFLPDQLAAHFTGDPMRRISSGITSTQLKKVIHHWPASFFSDFKLINMRPAQTKRKRFARSSHRTLSQSGQWQHLDVWWQSGSLPSEIRAETQCKSLSSGSVQAFKVFSIQLISRNFTKIRPQFSWFRRLGPTSKVTSDGGAKKRSSSFMFLSPKCTT